LLVGAPWLSGVLFTGSGPLLLGCGEAEFAEFVSAPAVGEGGVVGLGVGSFGGGGQVAELGELLPAWTSVWTESMRLSGMELLAGVEVTHRLPPEW
jgi:hypothetical protein